MNPSMSSLTAISAPVPECTNAKLRELIGADQGTATLDGPADKEIDGAYFGGGIKPANEVSERVDRRTAEEQTGKRQVVVVMRKRGGRTLPFVFKKESETLPTIRRYIPLGAIMHANEALGPSGGTSPAVRQMDAKWSTKKLAAAPGLAQIGSCRFGA